MDDPQFVIGIVGAGVFLLAVAGAIAASLFGSKITAPRTEPSFAQRPGTKIEDPPPAEPAVPKSPAPPGTFQPSYPSPGAIAGGWVIAVGAVIALAGLGAGFFAQPIHSAVQQAVSALWLLCGLIGLVISAIGLVLVFCSPASDRLGQSPHSSS